PSAPCTVPTTPLILPLSLHDALPIYAHRTASTVLEAQQDRGGVLRGDPPVYRFGRSFRRKSLDRSLRLVTCPNKGGQVRHDGCEDRKSTRLNSSHGSISYAVFCLKKK